ncbi:MAG: carbohydrate porin [Acinetobacter sp.]
MANQTFAANAFDVDSPYMLGDWNGTRTALKEKGYDFSFGYTGELANVLDSNQSSSHGTEYAGQFALGAHFDLEKILGWQDTEAQVTVTERHGRSLSNTSDALNGQISSTQEVWGRGQTWRLTEFWIKKKFFDEKLDVKAGRMGLSADFNSFACDFQNLALCGSQMGNWSGDQWYNWPVSQWGARVKYNIQPDLYAQVGAYEHNDENLRRSKGFNLSTDGSDGAVIPVELVWQPKLTPQALPGEYRVGYFYSTADSNKIDSAGNTLASTDHRQGAWITLKQQLTAHKGDVNRGLTAWATFNFFDDKTNAITNTQSIAVSYVGLFDARPQDEIAFGTSRIHKNLQGYGEEYNTELYYGIHATNWLTIRPNVQYVHNIGANTDKNAWVGGIKFMTVF